MNNLSVAAIPIDDSAYYAGPKRLRAREDKSRVKDMYSNEAILLGLRNQDKLIIKYIYRNYFQPVRFMVTSNSGSQMDAEDIFQDAMMVIFKKISEGNLQLTCAFNTYLYSICKHIWLQKLNKHGFVLEYKDVMDYEPADDSHDIEFLIEDNTKFKLFQEHFGKLNDDDQKMLRLFLKKIPLAEIARIMGYNSYDYAKVRKYIVKEKLKNAILNDPEYQRMVGNREMSMSFGN